MKRSTVFFLAGIVPASLCSMPACAQTPPSKGVPSSAGIVRSVLANSKLASVVDAPRHYRLARVSVPARQATTYSGASGFVFAVSGSLEVTSGSDHHVLAKGDGLFIDSGRNVTLKAGAGEPAVYLNFALLKADELNQPIAARPAAVTELYRTTSPVPGLKPGPYEFTLVRVSFPPRLPANPLHHRSGAALYFVQSGTGMITTGGKSELRSTGAIQYEPHDFIHQWGNPGDVPLVIIQANISQEGVPAVIFVKDEPAVK